MKLSHFAIKALVPYFTGDEKLPYRSGPVLVELFNKLGIRDVYDNGLPPHPKTGHGMARKQYVESRLLILSEQKNLRAIIEQIINESEDPKTTAAEINDILVEEKFTVTKKGNPYSIIGGVVDRRPVVRTDAHFKEIQDQILTALDVAKVSIHVAMAWFTNQALADKLVEKHNQGLDVQLVIFKDGVNKMHGVDLSDIPHTMVRGTRGGLMHHKFCVIDNQVVITGSYNWSDNAEFNNDENVLVAKDPEQASEFTIEFKRLRKGK